MAAVDTADTPANEDPVITPTTGVKERGGYREDIWVTDGAWLTGLVGTLAVFGCGYWFYAVDALGRGLTVFGWRLADNMNEAVLTALCIIGLLMVISELLRLWRLTEKGRFVCIAPAIERRDYGGFFKESLFVYLQNLLLFWLVVQLYENASQHHSWQIMVHWLWNLFLWLGLPYTLITRAYKYDPRADITDYPALITKIILSVVHLVDSKKTPMPHFGYNEKKIALGLVIKVFFAPLMTMFFFNQFPTMVRNIGYMADYLPGKIGSGNYNHAEFNKDFYNISKSIVLSVDVALAWVGYIVTSRWLDNQTQSAEPTLTGWLVCLLSYPPFQMLGLYFAYPAESAIFRYDSPWAITLFVVLAIISYTIYTIATLFFGVRFSNLTHRGVIRKGPFAIVRHPAYASKNLSWWLVILPAIVMNVQNSGYLTAIILTIGLAVQSWIYYMRAITEERHLSADPRYVEYCQHVKYRFIPGVI